MNPVRVPEYRGVFRNETGFFGAIMGPGWKSVVTACFATAKQAAEAREVLFNKHFPEFSNS